jgi:GTPase SAR1 family protein
MMRQLIVGMPNSGKSTFIAALRHLLVANEVPTRLELTNLAENESHLNRLEGDWLSCKAMDRTKPATEGWVEFHVRNRATSATSLISMPDLRGEAFEQPACTGQCHEQLLSALVESNGMLLFTNADREDDALLIDDLGDILADGESLGLSVETSFKPQNMPEEVKIVEFLQVANRRPARPKLRKIAVIVSAWDVVSPKNINPLSWVETNRPMLAQFLQTNTDLWDTRVYGVSAQGGRLPQERAELESIQRPSERIRVLGHDAAVHDLSAPVSWLMDPGS